tara:strand:- start:76 stop:441 length:366 start_codon:yes stop_codon:yes gene_type:complete
MGLQPLAHRVAASGAALLEALGHRHKVGVEPGPCPSDVAEVDVREDVSLRAAQQHVVLDRVRARVRVGVGVRVRVKVRVRVGVGVGVSVQQHAVLSWWRSPSPSTKPAVRAPTAELCSLRE